MDMAMTYFFGVLPSQYARRRHCTNKIQEGLCAKHKAETRLLRAKSKYQSLDLNSMAVTKLEMQEDKCGLCDVSVFRARGGGEGSGPRSADVTMVFKHLASPSRTAQPQDLGLSVCLTQMFGLGARVT